MAGNGNGYNGWTNYETWAVQLWYGNDQGSQNYWASEAQECWENAEDGKHLTRSEKARRDLADRLKDSTEENQPEAISGTLYGDLMGAALQEVNWGEIANAWLKNADLDGYEPVK